MSIVQRFIERFFDVLAKMPVTHQARVMELLAIVVSVTWLTGMYIGQK